MHFGSKYVYFGPEEFEEVEEEKIEVQNGVGIKTVAQNSRNMQNRSNDGETCLLDILDTAGQEEYSAMRDQYYRAGQGFLVMYSINARHSLEEATHIREQILRVKDMDWFPFILIGNKVDLDSEREISYEDGAALAAQWNVPFF